MPDDVEIPGPVTLRGGRLYDANGNTVDPAILKQRLRAKKEESR